MAEVVPELLVWRALRGEVDAGRPAVLAVVVDHAGSSPGRSGWVMAVGRDGWLAGTVGGGAAEVDAVRRAVALLAGGGRRPERVVQTHRRDAEHPSGLLCGGEQELRLVPLDRGDGVGLLTLDHALSRGNRVAWSVSEEGWRLGHGGSGEHTLESGPTHTVVVVGAGHVGVALAPLLVRLGFRVTVVDERPGAAWRLQGAAHEVRELAYERLAEVVRGGGQTFVVVATHAPERDAAAVEALAGVGLGFLGVLGTRAKLAHLPARAGLEAPVGVRISSHTPDEIAVSIAARLVAVRAGSGCP